MNSAVTEHKGSAVLYAHRADCDNGACLIIVSKESKKRRVQCHSYPAVKVLAP